MTRYKYLKTVSLALVTAMLFTACTNGEKAVSNELSTNEEKTFEQWTKEELIWPEWATPLEVEISEDIKYGPSVRKTYTLEEARKATRTLRYLVENTNATEETPYHNIWVNSLGTGLLHLGEYKLAYHYLNEVYMLPDDAIYGTDKVDDEIVLMTKKEEAPEKMLHGRLLKTLSLAGFNEEVNKLYADLDYTNVENLHSWGLTSAAWAMENIGNKDEAYKLFDLSYQPEFFDDFRPYQATSNILAAASFAYHDGEYDKVLEYTKRIVEEGVEPINMAYFKGQSFETEKKQVYFNRHWNSSYALAEGLMNLAIKAKEGQVADFKDLKDGTYTASHTGYMLTPIEVTVTVEGGQVKEITTSQEGEQDDRSAAALVTLPGRVIKEQSLQIDSISSATITSESFKLSVAEALLQAK